MSASYEIHHGDCIEIIKSLEDNSVDALITDSPYGLSFLGLNYDTFKSMAFLRYSYKWSKEALRILKPGAYLLNHSHPRKYHLMTTGIELAGYNIKDMIMWCYGSSIPNNLDLSKAIDKHLGVVNLRKKVGIRYRHGGGSDKQCRGMTQDPKVEIYEPYSEQAKNWDGWGTGLKNAIEPIVMAQKPLEGNNAENVLKWKVGGLNIEGCRIKYTPKKETDNRIGTNKTWGGKRKASKHTVSLPPIEGMQMYKDNGRWPRNFILTHHPECKVIGTRKVGTGKPKHNSEIKRKGFSSNGPYNDLNCGFDVNKCQGLGNYGIEIKDAYDCHPDCPIRMLDEQSGELGNSFRPNALKNSFLKKGMFNLGGAYTIKSLHNDKGGASRFFYCAKVNPKERNAGCKDLYWDIRDKSLINLTKEEWEKLDDDDRTVGNPISTLKPINLMRYLVRLVTPPGGTVLDPFAGSGTTGIACLIENFNCILIEKRDPFANIIIPKRMEYWKDPKRWKILKDHPLLPKIQNLKNKRENVSLTKFMEVS